ncbi:MAG: lytic transglycosylase domain-containing protein [Bdellovibrionales bacterium]
MEKSIRPASQDLGPTLDSTVARSNRHTIEVRVHPRLPVLCALVIILTPKSALSALNAQEKEFKSVVQKMVKDQSTLRARQSFTPVDTSPYFDIPVTYNTKVKWWINYFQTSGRKWFRTWLERSSAYLPNMKKVLSERGLPQDLAYVAMIESGFSPHATSTASAVGYWQFITPTANRYGLRTTWWLDERRDFTKSTAAASRYLGDLFKQFSSWYLTAAAYNMGEGRTQRLVKRYGTKNYWILSKKADFPDETRQYIPKLLGAMLIAKAPNLYGFRDLNPKAPYSFDYFRVPGGTDLHNLAGYLGIQPAQLTRLNPELVKGFVPSSIKSHKIRVPKGLTGKVAQFIRAQL